MVLCAYSTGTHMGLSGTRPVVLDQRYSARTPRCCEGTGARTISSPFPTSAPGLDWLTPSHICAGTEWAHPAHICAGTGWAHPFPQLRRD